jgi:hypothetical protein
MAANRAFESRSLHLDIDLLVHAIRIAVAR